MRGTQVPSDATYDPKPDPLAKSGNDVTRIAGGDAVVESPFRPDEHHRAALAEAVAAAVLHIHALLEAGAGDGFA